MLAEIYFLRVEAQLRMLAQEEASARVVPIPLPARQPVNDTPLGLVFSVARAAVGLFALGAIWCWDSAPVRRERRPRSFERAQVKRKAPGKGEVGFGSIEYEGIIRELLAGQMRCARHHFEGIEPRMVDPIRCKGSASLGAGRLGVSFSPPPSLLSGRG